MGDKESEVERRVLELTRQVTALRRVLIGGLVFFATLTCLLVGRSPDGGAILLALVAVALYWAIVVVGKRLSRPSPRDES
jgi:hypothetical protein